MTIAIMLFVSPVDFWMAIIAFAVLLTLFAVFHKASRVLFTQPQILAVLLLYSITEYLVLTYFAYLPTRREAREVLGSYDNVFLYEIFLFIFALSIGAFFSGLLTKLIIRQICNKQTSSTKTFASVKYWYPRSVLAASVGVGGTYLVYYGWLLVNNTFLGLGFFFDVFVCGLWSTLTFALYPLLIADEKRNLFKSLGNAFAVSFQTVNKWFYLVLATFLITGGFTYLGIFESVAPSLGSNPENVSTWAVHIRWLGGYGGTSDWYKDALKLLGFKSTASGAAINFFITSAMATVIKIKLMQILFQSNRLVETERI